MHGTLCGHTQCHTQSPTLDPTLIPLSCHSRFTLNQVSGRRFVAGAGTSQADTQVLHFKQQRLQVADERLLEHARTEALTTMRELP